MFHEKIQKEGLKHLRGQELNNHHFRAVVTCRSLNNTIRVKWNSPSGGPDGEKEGDSPLAFFPVIKFYKVHTIVVNEQHASETEEIEEPQAEAEPQPEQEPSIVQKQSTTIIHSRANRPKTKRRRLLAQTTQK